MYKKKETDSCLFPIFNDKVLTGYILDSNSMNFHSGFDEIKISLFSATEILDMSKGKISNTDTLNYKTLKPEKDGIFCPAIFGPTEDYKCTCGRYSGISYNGLRCERCNVVIGSRRLRRFNIGHIELYTIVVHPWFYRQLCAYLQLPMKELENITNFESFIFIRDSSDGKYKKGAIVDCSDYYDGMSKYKELQGGGTAIYELIRTYDYKTAYHELREYLKNKHLDTVSDKDLKRFQILDLVYRGKVNIENMMLHVIPVIPADLRPIFEGIKSSDLNELYKKLLSRTSRMKEFEKLEIERNHLIWINEEIMIAKAVQSLMGPVDTKGTKSIASNIKGKSGFFRRGLLGKRTDFSFRAVITVGPTLKSHQCCLPLNIAKELFRAVACSMMLRRKQANSVVEAMMKYKDDEKLVRSLLTEIIKDFPVLLNRAPTLHKLSIQSFEAMLYEGNSIKIASAVCSGYNADFDGDNVAGALPISLEARVECLGLMTSTHNLFSPSSGKLILAPSKDIVMGLYYMTLLDEETEIYIYKVYGLDELNHLVSRNIIHTNTRIQFLIIDNTGTDFHITNYGRLEIWHMINQYYDSTKLKFEIFNQIYDKNTIHEIVMYIFHNCGKEATIEFLNFLTEKGFYYLTKSGISYSPSDLLTVPDQKEREDKVVANIEKLNYHYEQGLITLEELEAETMSLWSSYIDEMSEKIISVMHKSRINYDDLNKIYGPNSQLMYISGTRGSQSQLQQASCLRGYMAKPSGKVNKFVIRSSLRSGTKVLEYFESTHGERKGLSDTAIKTSKSGHLSRKLVDVAHSLFIVEYDCETTEYLEINLKYDKRKFGINYEYSIVSRLAGKAIVDKNGKVIVEKNCVITEEKFKLIISNKVHSVYIRSTLFCKSEGICVCCYGLDLTTYKLVDIGTPIGILSAQSIGEPGTQLTMRTTHTGGIATTDSQESIITVESFGIIDYSELKYAINSNHEKIVYKSSKILVRDIDNYEEILEEIDVKEGSVLLKNNNEEVFEGDIIANKSNHIKTVITTMSGTVKYVDMVEGVTYVVSVDGDTGIIRKKIIPNLKTFEEYLQPAIIIFNEETQKEHHYVLEIGMFVIVNEGNQVKIGDSLAKSFSSESRTKDITGGLVRIINLFEVKKSNHRAIMIPADGIIKINTTLSNKTNKKNKILYIHDKDTDEKITKITVPKDTPIFFQHNQECKKGELVTDGECHLQDLYSLMGFTYTMKSIMGEISGIYEDQGVYISYKYFEIILKKMTEYCIVTTQGVSDKFIGTYLTVREAYAIKQKLIETHGIDHGFTYRKLILGITKVASEMCSSFISSASFQHTIASLANAAAENKTDMMEGIKENVIFGKLMPVGTGFKTNIIK